MAIKKIKKLAQFSPGRTILGSIIFLIALGTLALSLPICRTTHIPFVDILFTAASTTCVTGLHTVPLDHFSTIGHIVMMLLIQIGGLGLVTMTLFSLSLFVDLGLAVRFMAVQLLDLEEWKNVTKILIFIIAFTLTIELLGATAIFMVLKNDYPTNQAIIVSLFHAIATFCNAGITLLPNSMTHYASNYTMILSSAFLIMIGSLGFVTWYEIISRLFSRQRGKKAFSLQTRLVLYTMFGLIGVVGLAFWLLERKATLAGMPLHLQILNSFFMGLNLRGPGYVTVPMLALHIPTIFMAMAASFIGGSPGSTASGIKTTTFAIFLSTVKAVITGRVSVKVLGRQIANDQVLKAMTIISLSLFWIGTTVFVLLLTDPEHRFLHIAFEAVSAFATLGLSLGITQSLSLIGKCLLIASMIIGRIGSLTMLLALIRKPAMPEVGYPEERVMIG